MRKPHVRRVENDYGFGEENVLELIEKNEVEYVKSPRYQSIHKQRMICELARAKSSHKTLGQPKVFLNPPCNFLKKGARITPKRPTINHIHYKRPGYIHELPKWCTVKPPEKSCTVPPLPKDPAHLGRINFRKKNIEEVKKYERKPEKFKTVDTVKGDVQELVPSGLMPIYIYKKNFGQVPSILMSKVPVKLPHYRNRCISSSPQSTEDAKPRRPLCRYITEEEREQILQDMQKKRTEMMKTYQCLPFLIDTPPKVKRKAALEAQLKQLEKDIDLVENHPYIYVYGEKN